MLYFTINHDREPVSSQGVRAGEHQRHRPGPAGHRLHCLDDGPVPVDVTNIGDHVTHCTSRAQFAPANSPSNEEYICTALQAGNHAGYTYGAHASLQSLATNFGTSASRARPPDTGSTAGASPPQVKLCFEASSFSVTMHRDTETRDECLRLVKLQL